MGVVEILELLVEGVDVLDQFRHTLFPREKCSLQFSREKLALQSSRVKSAMFLESAAQRDFGAEVAPYRQRKRSNSPPTPPHHPQQGRGV